MRAIILIFLSLTLNTNISIAQNGEISKCSAYLYKPKKEAVPIYKDVDLASRVVGRAYFGDRVCVIGSDNDFLIIDRVTSSFKISNEQKFKEDQKLVYARKFDFWKTEEGVTQKTESNSISMFPLGALIGQAKKYFEYMRQGGIPEDPLAPYREMKDNYDPKDKEDCSGENCQ